VSGSDLVQGSFDFEAFFLANLALLMLRFQAFILRC